MRDAYWDVVKGLGILLVLLGHTGMFLTPYLYMYHVPLFFFVAGYFYNEKYSGQPFAYIGRKVEALWYPSARYLLFFVVVHNLLLEAGFYSGQPVEGGVSSIGNNLYGMYGIQDFILHGFRNVLMLELEELPSALWFIPMMFFDLIFLCAGLHMRERLSAFCGRGAWLVPAAFWLLLYLAGARLLREGIFLELHLHTGMVLTVSVVSGWLYRRFRNAIPCKALLSIAGLAGIILVYRLTGSHVELSRGEIISPAVFPAVTLLGIAFHLGVSRLLAGIEPVAALLSMLGRHSLFIIAFHFLGFRLVSLLLIHLHSLPPGWLPAFPCMGYPILHGSWWLLYVAGGIFVPLLILRMFHGLKKEFCRICDVKI